MERNTIASRLAAQGAARLLAAALAGALASTLMAQGYTDQAQVQGLNFVVPPTPIDFGTGVCFYDVDGDGWDDLTFSAVNDSIHFYRNVNGTLQRMPSPAFAYGTTRQVLWADIDNDGDHDLLTTTFLGIVRLYRNNSDWTFTDITATAGFVAAPGKRWGASFGDYDRDGFLDLYVCTYIYLPEPYAYSKLNHLYRNNGDGTFTDVTMAAGVGDGLQASFQSAWVDVDRDGWQDLYVINDFAASNSLYRNNGDGTFTNVAEQVGLAEPGEHPMSISLCDFDLDGDLDIFTTNTGIFPFVNNARHMLHVNNGDGTFTESSNAYGLDIFEWGWGAQWVDHDNDGFQDLYIATHQELQPAVANLFYRNVNGQQFQAANNLLPGDQVKSSHAVARGDLNGDGYADLAVQNQGPWGPNLLVNQGGTANHVRFSVQGTLSNRQGVGTWIKAYAGGRPHVHYTLCGENYVGQSSQHVLFGLGAATVVDSVVVEYLSGQVDRYYDLPVNTTHRFVEGETYPVSVAVQGPLAVCAPDVVVLDAGEHPAYLWSTGDTTRTITATQSGHYSVTVTSPLGVVATSAPVEVLVGPQPAVVVDDRDPACTGDSSGRIALENLTGVAAASVVWSPAGSGTVVEGLPAGVYEWLYTDVNGCTAQGVVELFDPETLYAFVVPSGATQGNNGSLEWTVFGGTPPYTVTVNGMLVEGGLLGGLAPGVYSLTVTDANDCLFGVNVMVTGAVGMEEWGPQEQVRLFPNPVDDLLHVQCACALPPLVRDAAGRLLSLVTLRGAEGWILEVAGLAAGVYLLEVQDASGLRVQRFVKQ